MMKFWQPGFPMPGQISGQAIGDGETTVVKINLSKSPYSVPTMDVIPDVVLVALDNNTTGEASIAHVADVGDILTITFDTAPGDGEQVGWYVTLQYNNQA
jgi:hypothetical protein